MAKSNLTRKINLYGWLFVIPAALFIFILNFYPMISAFLLSLQSGRGNNLKFAGLKNYARLFEDEMFLTSVGNVLTYLVIQVPSMLLLALILATILNDPKLKGKGIFRTMIFLPCATSLVSSAMIFKSLFSIDGIVNTALLGIGALAEPISWLTHPIWAKFVIILTITWRWTGYNTVFYLAGLQNIDRSVYEAARIDGASASRQFISITIPLLKPVILLTTIMSTNGTLQLFDEVRTLTNGGPGIATLSISQYIYNLSFMYNPQFGYAAAVSYAILVMVAVLSFVQVKVGDKR
ncbi:MAG: carbohydrate ABC transporter permease [Sphaerochaeta sp.]